MQPERFSFDGSGDLEIYGLRYPADEPKASLGIIHGMAEHGRRYDYFAKRLAGSGYSVYVYDQRGHGKTALKNDLPLGHLGDEGGWGALIHDLGNLVEIMEKQEEDNPNFLFGHSMGSFVARHYITEYGRKLDGTILSGTGKLNRSLLYLVELLTKLETLFTGDLAESTLVEKIMFSSHNSEFEPARTDFDWLSRDEEAVDGYVEDELAGFSCTTGFYDEFVCGLSSLVARERPDRLPNNFRLLFIVGEEDPVGGEREVRKLVERFRASDKLSVALKIYEEARHELIHEINRDEVIEDIVDWLDEILLTHR
jgi:alpha-beta hydrolase superfamily lysophospholipase